MALRVWLPLTGTLENKGTSNITISKDTEVTLNTNGKIGTCASCETSGKIITATVPGLGAMLGRGKSYTMCAWIKWLNHGTSGYVAQLATTNPTGFWWTNTSSNPRIVWNENDGGKRCGDNSLATDYTNWHHYAFVITKNADGTSIVAQHYTDGVRSTSYPGTTWNGSSQSLASGDTLKLYPYTASINDFRIYDHALSAAEVHEISQGLVLHYKLDHLVQPNLLTGNINDISVWTADGCTRTQDGNSIKVVDSNSGNRRIYRSTSNVWTPVNSTFTISFDAKAETNGVQIDMNRSNATGTNMCIFTLSTQWQHYSGKIVNSAAADAGTLSVRCRTANATFWLRNVKLERGDVESRFILSTENDTTIQDSSGYGHLGWVVGASLTNSDGRYSAATACIGTTVDTSSNTLTGAQYFFGNLPLTTPATLTVTWWGKNDAYGRGGIFETTATTFTATTGMNGTDYNTTAIANWDSTFRVYNGSSAFNFFSSFNKNGLWHHHGIVFDATKAYYYCDGALVTSGALTGTLPSFNGIRMGLGRAGGVYRQIKETVSDLRIYVTALSAADVKQLYEVGAKVDNLQNLHTFELNEQSINYLTIDSAWLNSSGTHNNINWSFNSDSSFTLNGTKSTSSASILIWNFASKASTSNNGNNVIKNLPNGTYIMYTGHAQATLQVYGTNSDGNDPHQIKTANVTPVVFTIDNTYSYNWVRLHIAASAVFNNFTFYPAIYSINDTISLSKNNLTAGQFIESTKTSFQKGNKVTSVNFIEK